MEIEKIVNKTGLLLSKYEKQNLVLKDKGKFDLLRANYTMKRFAEELCSYFVKEIKNEE